MAKIAISRSQISLTVAITELYFSESKLFKHPKQQGDCCFMIIGAAKFNVAPLIVPLLLLNTWKIYTLPYPSLMFSLKPTIGKIMELEFEIQAATNL
ncbi:MAG: hypothetical protein H6793_04215 [Candidatus Nomurabacteria bacterium]|nr:MAG: hypothetical protein H6793_04215 [Candidatus Nomurabacteria bacterium]